VEFGAALEDAQRSGLAEADPTLDIEGHDAAHKLCILVTLAFGRSLSPSQVYTEGISKITLADISYARELGYTVKLLAIAKDHDDAIEARVHPTMIRTQHLLARVSGAFNAIYVYGDAGGRGYSRNRASASGRRANGCLSARLSTHYRPPRARQTDRRCRVRILLALHGERSAGGPRQNSDGPRQTRHFDRLGHPAGTWRRNHRSRRHAHPS